MNVSANELEIREMRADELSEIVNLWTLLLEHHQSLDQRLYQSGRAPNQNYEQWVKRRLREDGAKIWVAEVEGHLVGYLLGMVGYRLPTYEVRAVGMICDLVIRPEHRRKAIGSRLVEQVIFAFLNQGIECIQVNYDVDNLEARAFWTSMGFDSRLVEAYRQLG